MSCFGNVLLDPGDVIEVEDCSGTRYLFPVMELTHRFDGGVRTALAARVEEGAYTAAAGQSVTQAIGGLKLDLGRFKRLYADDLSATNAWLEHLNAEVVKARSILVTDEDGSVILRADADTGELTATSGTIGNLQLKDGKLTGTFTKQYPAFTAADAEKIRQYAVGAITLTEEELEKYDVNLDGRVTSADALAVQKMVEGLNPDYSVYRFTIDPANATDCITVEVTEGYHAGWKTTVGAGSVSTRNLIASGGVTVAGEPLADFIVETGEDNGLKFEKWNSGKAVCWGHQNIGTVNVSGSWGNIFESTSAYCVTFPVGLFVDAPEYINVFFHKADQGAAFLEYGDHTDYYVMSAEHSGSIWLLRGTKNTSMTNTKIGCHAIGRWK